MAVLSVNYIELMIVTIVLPCDVCIVTSTGQWFYFGIIKGATPEATHSVATLSPRGRMSHIPDQQLLQEKKLIYDARTCAGSRCNRKCICTPGMQALASLL